MNVLMKNPIVEELESRFLSVFRAKANQLQSEFPDARITTWSLPNGSATSLQGHDLGIDCVFPDAPDNESDNVALLIGVMHLTTEPKICDAGVGWGSPADIELIESPVPYSEMALNEIEAKLPLLYEALTSALRDPRFKK